MSADLFRQAEQWLADDLDSASQLELADLIAEASGRGKPGWVDSEERAAALRELTDRFAGSLQFGTAGLRGQLGAGPNRMNRAVVVRAAAGLMAYLTEQAGPAPRVAIGFDARHGSRQFALDTAQVVTAAGGRAWLLPGPCPTPLLAHAVRAVKADAGVMVTASHNPAADNGYKVYLGGRAATDAGEGVQIVPPADSLIAEQIAAAPPARLVPRSQTGWRELDATAVDGYLDRAVVALGDDVNQARPDLRIVHTAMHGVGGSIALAAFEDAGFSDVVSVVEQARPDPDFPTVAFPNPEEPGAIDLALAKARAVAADLVIAHDPDADRCAAAVFDPRLGDWRMLTGDEVGALLGEQVAVAWRTRLAYEPAALAADNQNPTLACSIVSSMLLQKIATHHGLAFAQTLTGFKWIARTPGLVFGYEEAIGYCVRPDLVRDKDGITAGLALADLAAGAKAAGGSLLELLDDLARRHGLHLTGQVALRYSNPADLTAAVDRIVNAPPTELAGNTVSRTVNLAEGFNGLPPTAGIALWTEAGSRLIIRPSGTEPKVKCYLEVVQAVDPAASFAELTALRLQASAWLERLADDARKLLDTQ